ncbi:MAG: hypothetical protein AAB403_08220 [Planctomycetota bacterium]
MTRQQGYLGARLIGPVIAMLCCVPVEGQSSAVFLQLTNTTLSGSNHFPPGISKDGAKVAFLSRTNLSALNPLGDLALYVMNADGTGVVRIASTYTFGANSEVRPSFTLDATKIAFDARPPGSTRFGVFVANSDGTAITQVSPGTRNAGSVSMSSDGSTVVYAAWPDFFGTKQLYAVNSDGTGERLLVEGNDFFTLSSSSISGNGSRMTFPFLGTLLMPPTPGPLTWKVGVINTDRSSFITIDPNLGGVAVFLPAISDNGAKVAFSAFTSPARLYVANADGSNLGVLITGHDPAQGGVSLTADGSRVVYGLGGNVFTARTDASGVQQVTNNPGFLSYAPKINGAGTAIVFISNANLTGQNPDGNDEVFLATVEPRLLFPLKGTRPGSNENLSADSAPITSVFDHSMRADGQYRIYEPKDGQVVAYTDENAVKRQRPANFWQDCYKGDQDFVINGMYVGAVPRPDRPKYLCYDGHPGIDYRAVIDEKSDLGTEVYSTASGTIRYPRQMVGFSDKADVYNTFHVLELVPDGLTDYRIYYLHLSTHPSCIGALRKSGCLNHSPEPIPNPAAGCPTVLPVPEGDRVSAGCLIARSGRAGTQDPHLHFEVHKIVPLAQLPPGMRALVQCRHDPTNTKGCVPVDPYGWQPLSGVGRDPYEEITRFGNNFVANVRLWSP